MELFLRNYTAGGSAARWLEAAERGVVTCVRNRASNYRLGQPLRARAKQTLDIEAYGA